MSDNDLIIRPGKYRTPMTPKERLLTDCAITMANYAYYKHLLHASEMLSNEEERDLKRLSIWWNNLGVDLKQRVIDMMHDLSLDTEDMSGKSGRAATPGWSQTQ